MKFELIDRVLECDDTRAVAVKAVSRAEEYLGDHFPSFPVLPGVFMLEALVQTARAWCVANADAAQAAASRLVLGEVRALKYGTFVSPGDVMRIETTLVKPNGEDATPAGIAAAGAVFKGEARVVRAGSDGGATEHPVCVSGRFTLRPLRVHAAPARS